MFKRVFLLNGLAILAVVCSHAVMWGETAMTWWADRWRLVSVPYYDWDATLPYYLLLIQKKLAHFSVPAFLFFSGFFLCYAASGGSGLSWKTTRVRMQTLMIPFLIWSAVLIVKGLVEGTSYVPGQLVTGLLLGWPPGLLLWYPPVICFFYLLSPVLVGLARTRPILLVVIAGLLHLTVVGYEYARLGLYFLGVSLVSYDTILPRHFVMAFWFVLGLVAGIHRKEFASHLTGHAWPLFFAAVVLGSLGVCESELVYRSTSTSLNWSISNATLPNTLFALTIILLFLAMGEIPKSISDVLHRLGSNMYGIYLLHLLILEFVARATQKFIPGVLAFPMLFQVILVLSGVVGSMSIMEAVQRSPLRRYHRYLFG